MLRDLEVDLQRVGRDGVPPDVLPPPEAALEGVEAYALREQELLPSRSWEVLAHREPILVAPARYLELVSGETDEYAVDYAAHPLADQRVGVVARNRGLIRLAILWIADNGFGICQTIHSGLQEALMRKELYRFRRASEGAG